jgi:glutathione S-transferase
MGSLRLYDYEASANCYKVRLLLAQLGMAYERVPIDIFDGQTLTDEYARINPARSTPVLDVDGAYLPESGAIPPTSPRERRSCPATGSTARTCCAG